MMANCHFDALDRSRPFLVKEGRTALLIFARILYNMVLGVGYDKYTKQLRVKWCSPTKSWLHKNNSDEMDEQHDEKLYYGDHCSIDFFRLKN